MTVNVSVAIISAHTLPGNYVSELEDDFFYHFGDKPYYLNTRIFTLENLDNADKAYLRKAAILSVYDEDSFELYRFLNAENCAEREVSITVGDPISGISRSIMDKVFGINVVSAGATWQAPRFFFVEESHFWFEELEPLPEVAEYPGLYPGCPEWKPGTGVRRGRIGPVRTSTEEPVLLPPPG